MISENKEGKLYNRGFDKQGHAILYMKPALETSQNFDSNIKHLVFCVEMAIKSMEEAGRGAEKILIILDYKDWGLSKATPLKTALECNNILGNHYPERLFKAILLNTPFLFSVFWGAISPFVDPVTKAKMLMMRQSPLETVKSTLAGALSRLNVTWNSCITK